MKTPSRLTTARRGAALFGAVLAMFLILALGVAVLNSMRGGMHLTRHVEYGTLAFNIAESGVDRGARWLKDQPFPPSGTASFTLFGGAQSLGNGTYTVTVIPDAGNFNAILKAYKIVSVGTIYGRSQTVEVVLRQQSFGRYAYFTDREVSSVSGGRIWFFAGDKIRGPAHSNNEGGSNFQVNWTGSTQPIFEGLVTAAGPRIDYSPRNPSSEADFLKIFRDGSRGLQLDVDPIPLPSSSDMQRQAAWGGSTSYPSTTGVYTPANGGIYIVGDSTVTMSVSSGNQVFTIVQGSNTTTVTVNKTTNQRTVRVNSGPTTTVAGAGTGVLFSTGNITSLSGTVADNVMSGQNITARHAYTIAADVNSGKNITITNNLRYTSSPDPNLPTNDIVNKRPGTLGLIARNITVASSAPQNLSIDAVMLAGSQSTSDGSFGVANYNTKTPTGTLRVMGGIIQKARGAVGTFSSSSGTIVTGYAKDYHYDTRLADDPPPYFPTTGLYDVLSWRKMNY